MMIEESSPTSSEIPGHPRRRISWPRRVVGLGLLAVFGYVFFLFASGRVMTYEIQGRSMAPTLRPGDRVFVDEEMEEPLARGDIVIFPDPRPQFDTDRLVKRVIALPGDRVEVRAHRLFVNGVPERIFGVDDLIVLDLHDGMEITVRPGHIYVLGDNRGLSYDSSEFGQMRQDRVIGLLTYCYWPFHRLGYVN